MKHEMLCWCSKHLVNVQDANFVLHGRPAHDRECYERAVTADNLRQHRRAEAYAMRNGINTQRVVAERGG